MPQLENGYTRIADEIMDAFIAYRIPGEQMQCVLFIIKKTYGFNKIWDMISNSQFVEATGMAKQSVGRAINSLVDKNIVNKKVDNYIPSYRFNKNYKKWKSSTKRCTVNKKVLKVPKSSTKKLPTIDIITIDNNPKHEFHLFYKAYPKKKSPGQAKKTWLKLENKNLLPSINILLNAIEKQTISQDWKKDNGQYIPYPSSWLNNQGWEDEIKPHKIDYSKGDVY